MYLFEFINFLKSFRPNGTFLISRIVVTYRYIWAIFNNFSSPFEMADSFRFVFYAGHDKVF